MSPHPMEREAWSAIVICGVPQGRRFGMDLQCAFGSSNGSPLGILVRPGAHYVHSKGHASDACGTFLWLKSGEVISMVWKEEGELLREAGEEDEDASRCAVAAREGRMPLSPCPPERTVAWNKLVEHVDEELIERISPIGRSICSSLEPDPYESKKSDAETILDAQLERSHARTSEMEVGTSTPSLRSCRCYYTPIDRLVKEKNFVGNASQLTEQNLNRLMQLIRIVQTHHQGIPNRLLGEFEFSFVAFLLSHSLLSFLQWKDIIVMVLQSDPLDMDETYRTFLEEFLEVFHLQLSLMLDSGSSVGTEAFLEGELTEDILQDSFIKQALGTFIELMREAPSSLAGAKRTLEAIRRLTRETLGWDFDIVPLDGVDEFAPVVVEL